MDDDVEDDRRTLDRRRDAELVARLRAGDERAFGEIYDTWFDRVHDLAARIVRDPARAADVTQDTFLAAWRRMDTLADPASLGGWLLRICRNRALNVIEKEQRAVAVDDSTFGAIEAAGAPVNAPDGFRVAALAGEGDPARAAEDAEVVALLWLAADALGERDRTVLDLHLRHGLTPAEIGEVVGVNRNAANQLVHRVKGRLEGAVRARVLWRADGPACADLRRALADAGVDRFDSRAVTIANRHADRCERCGDDRHRRLQPAALFGAMPIVVAPFAVKQQAAAALAREGVPMVGSQAVAGSAGGSGDGGPGSSPSGHGATPSGAESPPGPATVGAAAPAGTSAGGAGDEGARAPGGADRSGARRGRRALVAGAVVLAVVAAVVGVVLATGGDDDGPEAVRTGADDRVAETADPDESAPAADRDRHEVRPTTTTSTPTTTTSAPSTTHPAAPTTAPEQAAGDPPFQLPPGDPGGAPATPVPPPDDRDPQPPAPPSTTTTRPRPTATASISITPAQMSVPVWNPFPGSPVLEWSATGGSQVSVTGPGFTSTARTSPAGGVYLCPEPPSPNWSTCVSPSGEYTYAIEVRDAGGRLLARKEATLTVA